MLIHGEDQIHASSDRGLAIMSSKSMAGIMNSMYRGRTCCVDRETEKDHFANSSAPGRLNVIHSYLGPFKLNVLPIRLLIMPGSTPVAA